MPRYIFIVGGVISGLGKGITAASISRLLTGRGYRVTNIKMDAYVNIDAGTMNPTEHGEVFVTDDGIETDQDVGNYERFLDRDLSRANYTTTGQVYRSVIEKERNLEYEGKCVEVVPHIPMEIIDRIEKAAKKDDAEVTVIEIGGTVGEYQNILFIEAARLMRYQNPGRVLTVLVSFVPIPNSLGEMKTKPTQYASRTLNETGIQADFIICRGERSLDEPRKERIALLCNMQSMEDIISAPDVDNIYKVPLVLKEQNLDLRILRKLGLEPRGKDLFQWRALLNRVERTEKVVNIAVVGKYFTTGKFVLADVYVSVIEAIKHGCWAAGVKPNLTWVDSEIIEEDPEAVKDLSNFDGVVIPGGFGTRGVEGIITALKYIRESKIPFLGLCYGLQMAAIEFGRNQCGFQGANTKEINPDTKHPIIHLMPDQLKKLLGEGYGGTMRLGSYPCRLKKGSLAEELYGIKLPENYPLTDEGMLSDLDSSVGEAPSTRPTDPQGESKADASANDRNVVCTGKTSDHDSNIIPASENIRKNSDAERIIGERHRHRYEFNNDYREIMEKNGLVFSGTSPDGHLVEIIELPREIHPFFIGVQFHPEFRSKPLSPHPLFMGFAKACRGENKS